MSDTTPTRVEIGYVTPTSREEFEIWARKQCYNLETFLFKEQLYRYHQTHHAWLGWQAAWQARGAKRSDL